MSKAEYEKIDEVPQDGEVAILLEALNFSKALTSNIATTSKILSKIAMEKTIPVDTAFIIALKEGKEAEVRQKLENAKSRLSESSFENEVRGVFESIYSLIIKTNASISNSKAFNKASNDSLWPEFFQALTKANSLIKYPVQDQLNNMAPGQTAQDRYITLPRSGFESTYETSLGSNEADLLSLVVFDRFIKVLFKNFALLEKELSHLYFQSLNLSRDIQKSIDDFQAITSFVIKILQRPVKYSFMESLFKIDTVVERLIKKLDPDGSIASKLESEGWVNPDYNIDEEIASWDLKADYDTAVDLVSSEPSCCISFGQWFCNLFQSCASTNYYVQHDNPIALNANQQDIEVSVTGAD
jgi:hypothetical protein